MMFKTYKSHAVAGLALALAAAISIQEAKGQVPAAPETGSETTLDTLIVTGSNIPTAQEVGPRRVQTITRAEIERSTYKTAAEILKTLPLANAGGVAYSNNATGFTPGASAVSLRGLGPDATLVLINGKRVANYPVGQNGNVAFVDLNTIPAAAVESVEILKDGASTIYGADAVAGVVNIRLRKDYEGVEVTTGYGNTTDTDSSEFNSSIVFGTATDTTRVTGVLNYYHRNSIFARDREYSRVPPFLSTNALPGNFNISAAAAVEATGSNPFGVDESGNPLNGFAVAPNASTGTAPAGAYTYGTDRTSLYNFNKTAGAFPEREQYGGTFNFEHDLVKDTATLYGTLGYSSSYTRNENAPGATGNFANPEGVSLIIPARTANPILNIVDGQTGAVSQVTAGTTVDPTVFQAGPGTVINADGTVGRLAGEGAFNPNNPFNEDISGGSRFRLAEFGNRVYEDETDAFIFQTGIKGRNLPGDWGYDFSANYSKIKTLSTARQVDALRFNQAVDANSGVVATPYNPFGGVGGAGNDPATIAYARAITKDRSSSELWTLDLNVYKPELLELPGGGLGVALGAQYRREEIAQNPDPRNLSGRIVSNTLVATNADRETASFYSEVRVPIVGEGNSLPGIKSLEVSGSFRYEEVLDTSANVLVPSTSLRWQPVDDLTMRGTYGKGYKQPSLYQLSSPGVFTFSSINDTNSNLSAAEVNVRVLGNPDLEPEDSETFTAGFTYTPRFIPGLTVTADYFQIERSGVVGAGAQNAYNRFVAGASLPSDNVAVFPGSTYSDDDPTNNDPADIDTVYVQYSNAERYVVKGWDFGLEYAVPTEKYGNFTLVLNATYLDSFQSTLADGSLPLREVSGRDSTGFGDDGYLKWKGVGALIYDYKSFSATATVNFTDGFEDLDPNGVPFEVNSLTTLDLLVSYTFGKNAEAEIRQNISGYSKDGTSSAVTTKIAKPWYADTTLSLGVRNVTDEKPPLAYGFGGNANGYPGYIYSSEGRFVFVSVTKKF